MDNNIATPSADNNVELVWEAPVLYKEDWMNTLTGTDTTSAESGPMPDYLS